MYTLTSGVYGEIAVGSAVGKHGSVAPPRRPVARPPVALHGRSPTGHQHISSAQGLHPRNTLGVASTSRDSHQLADGGATDPDSGRRLRCASRSRTPHPPRYPSPALAYPIPKPTSIYSPHDNTLRLFDTIHFASKAIQYNILYEQVHRERCFEYVNNNLLNELEKKLHP